MPIRTRASRRRPRRSPAASTAARRRGAAPAARPVRGRPRRLVGLPPAEGCRVVPRAWPGTGRAVPLPMMLRSASWLAMTCLALAACAGDDSAAEDTEDGFVVED